MQGSTTTHPWEVGGGELAGRYRIEGCVGRGGMGEVFKAFDQQLGRWVAVKSIPGAIAQRPDRRQQLLQEARTVAALNHPAIAQIYDVLTCGEREYLVFEFVEGQNLAAVLEGGTPSLRETVSLARDIADGLQAAHALGVVHRDLKPENVIVTPAGRAKILDFGLAVACPANGATAVPAAAGVAGTVSAMSPEQVQRQPVGHRSDLFSLGTLVYQMLTGRHPFRSVLPVETMHRIANEAPPAVRKLEPAVPRELSEVVDWLLAKEPDDRPADAAEVVVALDRLADKLRPAGAARRRRLVAAAGVAALCLAVAAGVWHRLQWEELEPLHVAVLETETDGADPHARLPVVAAAVRMAAMNALAGLDQVFPINTREVDGAEGKPTEIAYAVAADEILIASVASTGKSLMVSMGRVDGQGGHSLWTGTFEVPGDNLQLLADTVTAHLRQGYRERPARAGAFQVVASAEDYEAYLEVRKKVYDPPMDVSWTEVLEELHQIRESSPRLLSVYSLESEVARFLFTTTRDERHREYATRVVERALDLAPNDQTSLLSAIDLALATGDLEVAAARLDEAERVMPSSFVALSFRARLLERQGQHDEALALLREVAEARPSWWFLLTLAQMEQRQADYSSARRNLTMARSRAPNNTAVISELARLELLQGDMEAAEEACLDLVGRSPRPEHLNQLGLARLLLGRYEEAIDAFERAYDLGSRAPETMLNLADAWSLQGNAANAQAWYERVLQGLEATGPLDPGDLGMKAQCLAQLGQDKAALAAMEQSLELAPRSPQIAYAASLVLALVGDSGRSSDLANRALDGGVAPTWFALPWFDSVQASLAQTPEGNPVFTDAGGDFDARKYSPVGAP